MKKKILLSFAMMILVLMAAGCNSEVEEIIEEPIYTPAPTPTPTPTPNPAPARVEINAFVTTDESTCKKKSN